MISDFIKVRIYLSLFLIQTHVSLAVNLYHLYSNLKYKLLKNNKKSPSYLRQNLR